MCYLLLYNIDHFPIARNGSVSLLGAPLLARSIPNVKEDNNPPLIPIYDSSFIKFLFTAKAGIDK